MWLQNGDRLFEVTPESEVANRLIREGFLEVDAPDAIPFPALSAEELEVMPTEALRYHATALGIPGRDGLQRQELIAALLASRKPAEAAGPRFYTEEELKALPVPELKTVAAGLKVAAYGLLAPPRLIAGILDVQAKQQAAAEPTTQTGNTDGTGNDGGADHTPPATDR